MTASPFAIFQEIALMMVTEHWIPYDNTDELTLLTELNKANRRFIKCLSYNLTSTVPTVSVLLSEKDRSTTAVFVLPTNATQDYKDDLQGLIYSCGVKAQVWEIGNLNFKDG